jgi:uncharacterized phage protein gp47/JayE
MPFDRPDLQTLITRTSADLNSRWAGTYNRLRRSVLSVIARVLAGLAHGLYGYLGWITDQILPDTMEAARLRRYGAILGVPFTLATKATGAITVTGTNGVEIPAGTLWQRDDGTEYIATATATISGGTADVSVQASDDGAAPNTDAAEVMTIVSPISGLNPEGAVATGGITGGADEMDIETYRTRVLSRTAQSFTGANAAIYEKWALEVEGVTRAWVYEETPAAGSVTVLFVCDDDDSSIMPDAGKITDVEDYLEEHTDPATGATVGRAVNVTLVVDAPGAHEIDLTLLPSPNTDAVKAAITAELTDMLRRDAAPGVDILISRIREAISTAAGETDYVLTSPSADVAVADGDIAVLGTITWA